MLIFLETKNETGEGEFQNATQHFSVARVRSGNILDQKTGPGKNTHMAKILLYLLQSMSS